MESKLQILSKHTVSTLTEHGYEQRIDYPAAMQEFSNQQNAGLIEVLNYAVQTVMLLSEHKPIRGLDERIAYFQQTLKENGK